MKLKHPFSCVFLSFLLLPSTVPFSKLIHSEFTFACVTFTIFLSLRFQHSRNNTRWVLLWSLLKGHIFSPSSFRQGPLCTCLLPLGHCYLMPLVKYEHPTTSMGTDESTFQVKSFCHSSSDRWIIDSKLPNYTHTCSLDQIYDTESTMCPREFNNCHLKEQRTICDESEGTELRVSERPNQATEKQKRLLSLSLPPLLSLSLALRFNW